MMGNPTLHTGKMFNEGLKRLLGSVIDYKTVGNISLHSFRIGITGNNAGKVGFL